MDIQLLSDMRTTGLLLLLSIAIPATVYVVLALRGQMAGASASFRGVEGLTEPPGAGLRYGRWIFVPALIALLVGFNMLSIQLEARGDDTLPTLAFNLMLFMAVLHLLEGSFNSTVTLWAADLSAQGEAVPVLYEQLRRWVIPGIQHGYMMAGMLAMTFYGGAILRTGLLPGWIGWLSIGWGALWVVVTLIAAEGFPLALYILPVVFGIALLV